MKNHIDYISFAIAIAVVVTFGLLMMDVGLTVLSTRSFAHTPIYIIGVKMVIKGLHDIKQAFIACTGKGTYISID